jgi:fatty acid desaturase
LEKSGMSAPIGTISPISKERYFEIRARMNLSPDPYFLIKFGLQSAALVTACFWILANHGSSPLRFLAVPLISLFMFRSFAFMHEAVHGLLSKNSRTNHFLGIVSGAFCLLSYDSWKKAHIDHHRWSGNIDKDPVAAMIKTFPKFPGSLKKILTFGWKCWLPTLSFLQHTVFWAITIRYTASNRQSMGQIMSAVIPAVFWVSVLSFIPLHLTLSVIIPSIVLYLIGTEVINAPHHLGLTYYRGETKIPLWEQFRTARTCVYPKWLARFVVLNFNYHAEHHMYPYVPWYHLDKLHQVLRPEIGEGYNLDPSFSWVLTNRSKDLVEVFGSNQVTDAEMSRAA